MPLHLLGGLGKFLTGAAAHEATREVIKGGLNKAVEVVIKRGEELIKADPRPDYLEVLRHLETDPGGDPAAAARIRAAQQQALDAHVENLFVVAMGSYIPRDKATGAVKMAEAIERFAWLGGKAGTEFELAVETLKHDPVAQFFRYWLIGNMVDAWNFVDSAAERLADELQPGADRRLALARRRPTWRTLWLDL